ncbi:HWE histidine kinase domain-containing protein [Phenylobacterium sp.]|uniref:HWE histidine kinase domain-containing protein n=1 Tax=Phenylobacterium sp. TaxID=1871053 RepID=UPI002733E68D|nr:HWE histidine kinase domain-containing protein [Phenylobacterium sp.]MDP3659183.1 HWE histidine kinase domain-containing protein [Phenylobacterium sp.]
MHMVGARERGDETALVTIEDLSARLAMAENALAEESRRADLLNRIAAAIGAGSDLSEVVQTVVDGGVELTGAQFGAFFYNLVDADGESYTLYTLSGAPRSAFADFPMPRNTAVFAPTFSGAGLVRSDDITKDPRYGHNAPHHGMPTGHLPVRSYLAAPVVSGSGEVLGGLFFGHAQTGMFTPRLEPLLHGLSAQAAVAIDNVRLGEAARRDLQQRRRVEAALAESESRFRMIANTLPTLCWEADLEGRVTWRNQRWHDYVGVESYLPGAFWYDVDDAQARVEAQGRWREAQATGGPLELVLPLRGRDGVARPFLTRVEAARDAVTDEIVRWMGVNLDIAAETAAHERLQFALQAGRLGSWELDVETRDYTASDLCKANYGRRPDETFGFHDLVAAVHDEDRDRMRAAIEHAIATGADYDIEYRAIHPSGDVRWVHARGRVAEKADHGGVRRMAGVSLDITERKRAEERQRLLLNELNHRVKNTLATVQSIASQTLRSAADTRAFRDAFESRLLALSQTHNLLTDANWEAASLHAILVMELSPHAGGRQGGGGRFVLESDRDIRLNPKAAVALGMALHELATNAVKYGALSTPSGRVLVRSRVSGADLVLEWIEQGGPTVVRPSRRGFGGRLLEQGLAGELAGRVVLTYDPAGLSCRMQLPMRALEPTE